MKPSKYTILVVDDEERLRNLIVTFLSRLGHSCVTAMDGVDALDKIKGYKIDAVVTDIKMPNMDGITLAAKISMHYPELPIMIMTAFEEDSCPFRRRRRMLAIVSRFASLATGHGGPPDVLAGGVGRLP